MNHYNLWNLTNDAVAERRAEADRSRLARSGHAQNDSHRPAGRPARRTSVRLSLGSLLHRVALF